MGKEEGRGLDSFFGFDAWGVACAKICVTQQPAPHHPFIPPSLPPQQNEPSRSSKSTTASKQRAL